MHQNNGNCLLCDDIFGRFHGFDEGLRTWFKKLQKAYPDAHISCAGRGRAAQEAAFMNKRSKARFGQSAHNYNAAIDVFCNGKELYPVDWFEQVVGANIDDRFKWYGKKGSPYYELPHVEISDWKILVKERVLKLVAQS